MHQTLTTPEASPQAARKQRARRRKQIVWGAVGFFVLWLIVSIALSKREKPIPVTTEKAVRKTVSGLLKILHPHGQWTHGELREYLEVFWETGLRRLKRAVEKEMEDSDRASRR